MSYLELQLPYTLTPHLDNHDFTGSCGIEVMPIERLCRIEDDMDMRSGRSPLASSDFVC